METSTATALSPEVVEESAIVEVEKRSNQEGATLADRVKAITINSNEDAQAAADLRGEIVERRKAIEEWFREPVAALHKAHRAMTQRRAQALAPYKEPEDDLAAKITAWQDAEERRIREEEAERERQRLAQAEADRKAAEEAQLERAIEAEEAGDAELAERIADAAPLPPVAPLPPPPPVSAPTRIAGVSRTKRYEPQVVDLYALIRAAAQRPELAHLLQPDMVALRKMARQLGPAMKVDGVVLAEKSSLRQVGR